jgi:hypothetical protein
MKNQRIDGTIPRDGETVTVDHSVRTFMVQIRSINTVGPESLKQLIEQKFEVTDIQETDGTYFVRGSRTNDF